MLDKWHVYCMDVLYAFGMLGTYCVGFSKGLEQLVNLELNQKLRLLC